MLVSLKNLFANHKSLDSFAMSDREVFKQAMSTAKNRISFEPDSASMRISSDSKGNSKG